jgi:hypothetical protein
MIDYLYIIGAILAIGGSLLSIYGALIFNLRNDYTGAKVIWALSNPMLLFWAIGYVLGFWDSIISVAVMGCMYTVYTLSNWYGLWKK